jgi:uncharacterized membrane protein
MKPLILAPILAALAGCATGGTPLNPVKDFQYGAIGHDPFWLISIGDDRIVLTLGPEGGRADGELVSYDYPRALPRTADGVRRWESGDGTKLITVEARPGPCTTGGRTYQDRAIISLSGRVMEGCGGREIPGRTQG